ncbi:MAG: hypothetical protein AB1716_07585 [Planctomycetota bacterium]
MKRVTTLALCGLVALGACGFVIAPARTAAPDTGGTADQAAAAPPGVALGPAGELDGPWHFEGGDDCNMPATIAQLPVWLTGSTAGHTNNYFEACPRFDPNTSAPDAVYALTPAADLSVNISLCHPGTAFDTKLYVYKSICTSEGLIACNDEACPGHRSQILDLALLGGTTYFIVVDGYNGARGPYEMTIVPVSTPPPACPANALFSQRATGQGFAGTSDAAANYIRYEQYSVAAPIQAVRFWGCTLRYSGGAWSACFSDPKRFEVKFYADQGGAPGALVCSESAALAPANSWIFYGTYPLYQYDLTLAAPCPQTSGWVSIQGRDPNNPTDPCWFLWMSAPTGDGRSWFNSGSGLTQETYDLALCLAAEPLGAGACCLPDGTCQVLTSAQCQAVGGVHRGEGVPCDPNPCGTPLGACCISDDTCLRLTQAECALVRRGDADCDGYVDFRDINPFVAVLAGGTPCLRANCDVNGDGFVDFNDINAFVDVLVYARVYTGQWLGPGTGCEQCP